MSLEEDYQRDTEKIHELGLAVTKLATYQAQYAIHSVLVSKGKVETEAKRRESREGIRMALAESKQLLEDLIRDYPI